MTRTRPTIPDAGRVALVVLTGLLATAGTASQESPGYRLTEHVFNAGGHPEGGTALTSTSYRVTLDAVGESIAGSGLQSTSYRADSGFGSAHPPPGEVLNLRFIDDQTLVWDPEKSVGVYVLYRDVLSSLSGLGYGVCRQQALANETATDNDPVPVADGFFYLVTAESRLGEEGTKGTDGGGMERQGNACP